MSPTQFDAPPEKMESLTKRVFYGAFVTPYLGEAERIPSADQTISVGQLAVSVASHIPPHLRRDPRSFPLPSRLSISRNARELVGCVVIQSRWESCMVTLPGLHICYPLLMACVCAVSENFENRTMRTPAAAAAIVTVEANIYIDSSTTVALLRGEGIA